MGYLDNVGDENSFYLDGNKIYNLKELLKELRIMSDEIFRKHVDKDNDFYNWINHSIKDNKLASKIKNLTLKKNFIKIIGERIDFLERLGLGTDTDKINISLNTHDQEIIFSVDKEKCILCDICMKVCPQDAIEINGAPLSIKVKSPQEENNEINVNLNLEPVNVENKETNNDKGQNNDEKLNKCVLCGLCVPFCPVSALDITVDGKKKNPMADTEAIPVFNEPVNINGVKINKFFEGTIKIDSSKCPNDCEECVSACPTFAIKRNGEELAVNEDHCFYCGACVLACPEKCITLRRSRISYKGGFCSNWNDVLEKLIGPHYINIDHDNRSMKKIYKLIKANEIFNEYDVQANIKKEIPELQEEKKVES